MKTLIAGTVLMIGLAGAAGASEPGGVKPLDANTPQTFQTTAANVRTEMRPGGRYAFVTPAEHSRVDLALSDIDKAYAEARIDQDTKVRVFNDQELVNSILERRDERMICANEVATGSHVRVTKCATYAQEAGRRDASLRD